MLRTVAIAVFMAVLIGGVSPTSAGDGRVPFPVLAKAKGEQCVEPADDMRRNHMLHLKHQRDETMHKGVRSKKHSLKECVACHASPDAKLDGARTVRGFCKQCHAYAAVQIDCFHCHTPKAGDAKGGKPMGEKP